MLAHLAVSAMFLCAGALGLAAFQDALQRILSWRRSQTPRVYIAEKHHGFGPALFTPRSEPNPVTALPSAHTVGAKTR